MADKPTPTDAELKAMWQLHAADVPECGEFSAIAQDLDWLCESFGIKGGQHAE